MNELTVIDAFEPFPDFWEQASVRPLNEQIENWFTQYISQWPELQQILVDCYEADGEDWREIAREHVFPNLDRRLPLMSTARANLLDICPEIFSRCQERLDFQSDLVCVIYVGIGCGAGWATTYEGKPAVLFGLENIAEEGWQDAHTLAGLMAHELSHLVHFHWREQAGLTDDESIWWQLYTEGFAQYCEGVISGSPSWHMHSDQDPDWLNWCQANVGWLASEFLARVESGGDLRPFFGSWFQLQGHKQTGYFLGYELVRLFQQTNSLRQIALLPDLEGVIRPLLKEMSGRPDSR